MTARTLQPVTIRELRFALQDEWAAMPQQLIDTLILSMGRRCETCLAEDETDQAIEEPDEIMHINRDSESKYEKSDRHETFELN
ncbi:hypothetical protein TNCV_4441121 [Trichonephila clavipes]|nr:hypothetical protein TNCV_4441121 [Trichonephila clavipes]